MASDKLECSFSIFFWKSLNILENLVNKASENKDRGHILAMLGLLVCVRCLSFLTLIQTIAPLVYKMKSSFHILKCHDDRYILKSLSRFN